ncbi:hypothetical protein DAI22_04g145600 [Oryza sativa Japonica Group]|nr:hypothetical protein DAI22_04g145600 [Oryza sativa Japonica Group]
MVKGNNFLSCQKFIQGTGEDARQAKLEDYCRVQTEYRFVSWSACRSHRGFDCIHQKIGGVHTGTIKLLVVGLCSLSAFCMTSLQA